MERKQDCEQVLRVVNGEEVRCTLPAETMVDGDWLCCHHTQLRQFENRLKELSGSSDNPSLP